jgi:hypothetical protein
MVDEAMMDLEHLSDATDAESGDASDVDKVIGKRGKQRKPVASRKKPKVVLDISVAECWAECGVKASGEIDFTLDSLVRHL